MKVTSSKLNALAKENSRGPTVMSTLGSGKTTRQTDKALSLGSLETNTSVNSKKTSYMDKALTLGPMETNTSGSG